MYSLFLALCLPTCLSLSPFSLGTVGYVADRFEGNTNGKGAAVGIFNAVGFPFPSPGPGLQFLQWFGTEIFNGGAYSYSKAEDVPAWWTDRDRASEGYL